MCNNISMETNNKQCKKCGFTGDKDKYFKRSKIRDTYQYGDCKKCHQEYTRAWRYGITVEQMRELLNIDCCEICERGFEEAGRKVIDHCHITGEIRGILCDSCNTTLGQLKKTPYIMDNYISYMIKHKLN